MRQHLSKKKCSFLSCVPNMWFQALSKLHEIEVQLNSKDLPRNSAELADRHSQLSNVIVEVSMSAQTEGRLLLERVSRDDVGADGVRRRVRIISVSAKPSCHPKLYESPLKACNGVLWIMFICYQKKYHKDFPDQVGNRNTERG